MDLVSYITSMCRSSALFMPCLIGLNRFRFPGAKPAQAPSINALNGSLYLRLGGTRREHEQRHGKSDNYS